MPVADAPDWEGADPAPSRRRRVRGLPPAPPLDAQETPASQGGRDGGDGAHGEGEALDWRCARLALTDLGNAERFVARFGEDFRWCSARGWLGWDGRRWDGLGGDEQDRSPPGAVMHKVYETIRAIRKEAAVVAAAGRAWDGADGSDPDPVLDIRKDQPWRLSDAIRAHAKASESAARLGAVAKCARPWLEVEPEKLDADPMKLNCMNGTIVFIAEEAAGWPSARAELRPHERADLMTRLCAADYLPEADAPRYDAFLARVQPDAGVRDFLHAWGGYSLSGDTREQALVFFYGTGGNGKSVWVDTIAHVMGDYATSIGIESLIDAGRPRSGNQASPDLARLAGARFIRSSEPERGQKLADGLVKLVTGGEPLLVRHLNMPFFEMVIQGKLTISGNYRPKVGTDEGIWRRMRLVPWTVTVPKAERDKGLADKLRAETAGILARLVRGACDWLANGLPEVEAIADATQEYRESVDPLGRFLDLCVERAEGERCSAMELWMLFNDWARWAGEKEWSQKGLKSALEERGYRSLKSSSNKWLDIRLVKSAGDFVSDVKVESRNRDSWDD